MVIHFLKTKAAGRLITYNYEDNVDSYSSNVNSFIDAPIIPASIEDRGIDRMSVYICHKYLNNQSLIKKT